MRAQQRTIDRVHNGAIPFDTFVSMLSTCFLPKVLPADEVSRKITKALKIFNQLHRGEDDGYGWWFWRLTTRECSDDVSILPSLPHLLRYVAVSDFAAMMVRQGDALDEASLKTVLQTMKLDGRRIHGSEIVRTVLTPPS